MTFGSLGNTGSASVTWTTQTSAAGQGPPKTPPVATATDFPDNIEAIGDQLAALTVADAAVLQKYLAERYGLTISL